jgi:hypothetical protein
MLRSRARSSCSSLRSRAGFCEVNRALELLEGCPQWKAHSFLLGSQRVRYRVACRVRVWVRVRVGVRVGVRVRV